MESGTAQLINILGFHTCSLTECLTTLLNAAPFRSRESNEEHWQWLGTGYYFWTDSDHFAHQWGKNGYKNCYAIVECNIEISDERYLDLVGNVADQVYFVELMDAYRQKLSETMVASGRKLDLDNEIKVCKVIEHYQLLDLFDYDAIKASDEYYKERSVSFTPRSKEKVNLITRQQLCLSKDAIDKVVSKKLHHPA